MANNIDLNDLYNSSEFDSSSAPPMHADERQPKPAPSAPAEAKVAPVSKPAASAPKKGTGKRAVSSVTQLVADAKRLLVQREQRLAAERRAGLVKVFAERDEGLPTTAAITKLRTRIESLEQQLDAARHKLVADEVDAAVKALRKEHGDASDMDAEALIEHFGGGVASA